MSQTPSTASPSLYVPSARERSAVRRLATARLISLTGSGAAFAALAYIMFQLTGETRWVSWTLLLTLGAQGLFAPLGSALGDRFDRRKVLVLADLAAAVGFVALAFAQTPATARDGGVTATPNRRSGRVRWAVLNLVGPGDLTWANGAVAVAATSELVGPIRRRRRAVAPDSTEQPRPPATAFGLNAISFADRPGSSRRPPAVHR
jgi:MFS family permease